MSDVERNLSCPSGGRADTAALYLAGRLSVSDAEAFEEHYFSCPDCREDVRRGAEVRETLGKPAIAFAVPERRSARRWFPLAAAAAIAFVGIGLWQLALRTENTQTVSRGAAGFIAGLAVSPRSDGGLEVTWEAPRGAASYEIQIFSPQGRRLWKTETREPRARVESAILSPPEAAGEIHVDALDATGQVVASGEIAARLK
jgi:putative zinc finger protein